ncbi:Uncharacterised protein [Moraxella caviae]|uniref:Uncharacterized protein n=1 Tax=Moraxella caviae TaxID=34060 RepID=A0A378R581_9GAMM|nr:Uncharacterised protein [Moraxella caviae]
MQFANNRFSITQFYAFLWGKFGQFAQIFAPNFIANQPSDKILAVFWLTDQKFVGVID